MAFLAVAGVFAVLDWIAVERDNQVLEYVAKPATTAALLAAALALHPASGAERVWFVVALAFCLLGDVFLMLPQDLFVPGLASFLVGHICFIAGFSAVISVPRPTFFPIAIVVMLVVPRLAMPIVRGARSHDRALVVPVLAYIATLLVLVLFGDATGQALALAGAVVFVTSDTILARNRFVRPFADGHLLTMVTYHAALALLVLSLR